MENTISKTLVVVLAIAFGALLAGPFIIASGPLYPELANDQNFYLSRIQDVREGHPMSGNTYLAEHKNNLPMQFLTGEYIESKVLDLFPLPTSASLILFPLIFGPIIFLLIYAICIALGAPRFFAILVTMLLVGGVYFSSFMRPISPQFNLIFWLIAVIGLLSYDPERVKRVEGWRWVLLQSLAVGILFYLYPYYWTHLLAVYGLLTLFYVVRDRATALKLFAVIAGAVVVGAGYISLVLQARALPDYQESLSRLGFIATHTPSGVMMAAGSTILVAAVLYLAYRRRIMPVQLVAALALVVGGLVAMNQHVITGINMEFSSHYAMQITFANAFLIVAVVSAMGWWKYGASLTARAAALIIVLSIVAMPVLGVYRSAAALATENKVSGYGELVRWLDTAPAGVVYAPEAVALFIPAYTRHDVFYARNANIAFMPNTEVMDRFIINNFSATITADFIAEHEREIFGHHYMNRYQHARQKQKFLKFIGVTTTLPERIPAEALAAVKARAKELQSKTFSDALAPYQVNYIIIDTSTPNQLTPEDLAFAQLVFTTIRFEIYTTKQ